MVVVAYENYRNFHSVYNMQSDTYTDDFDLLSVVGAELVSPSTLAFYICQRYSLVFVVDMSANMMAVVRTHMHTCVVPESH